MPNSETYLQTKVYKLESKVEQLEKSLQEQSRISDMLERRLDKLVNYDEKETSVLNLLQKRFEENRAEIIDMTHTINNITKIIESLEKRFSQ